MMCTHYKKVLFVLCLCSLQTIFCMESAPDKDSVAPQGKGLSLNPIELASKYKLSQKTGTFFNTTERVLRKTVDVAGKAATQTLGFVWHHPFISLGVTGAVLMYSPALRSYIYNTAWNKGFAHARATAREFLGLNEQDARLVRLEGASDVHTAQLGRIEAASGRHTEQLDGLAAGLEDIRTSQRSFVDRIAHVDGSIETIQRDIRILRALDNVPGDISGLRKDVSRISKNQVRQFGLLREDLRKLLGGSVRSLQPSLSFTQQTDTQKPREYRPVSLLREDLRSLLGGSVRSVQPSLSFVQQTNTQKPRTYHPRIENVD